MTEKALVTDAKLLAEELIDFYSSEEAQEMNEDELLQALTQFSQEITVSALRDQAPDGEILDEISYREISCLSWADEELLLEEVNRRRLPLVKVAIPQHEFQRSARERGFKRSLREFPRKEIQNYLKIQGL